ncbi:MAG: repressor in ring oxydation complex/phenylacetic acid degradation pathway related protein (PaaX) [uncultured bacterium]|nr:MAG: repressor in ring oxydation complex/phenylacetic acid degradation pathway related protein (PaaX) [uncultured bacterium]KKP68202.1 MAG: Transcriptional regulator, PaaX family [Candidatus Moranbacteria bacterium GW2011_GWE1_35_17]KKP82224.1 MAG: Transcriptional regulator, PaaX family [Candidatus Moranbacteria bacterium GW2011_GWF2_35_54]KKP83291.1 MAG: Transcriptional regulator, PaaX family [Candidatus Moranbacteria bacterium GW2011_GWF1_35_5]HBR79357.1 hypothetical protein [Candidatus Mo
MYRFGENQQKVMLILLGGVALGLSNSPSRYFDTFRKLNKDWKNINQRKVNLAIAKLSEEKLIEEKKMSNGSFKLVLTPEGHKQASRLNLIGSTINFKKPTKWDKKWRIVIFDIPEKDREFRGILRKHLFTLEFYKLQQSVFISPHPYEKPILELIRLYSATNYVRVITAMKIDNEDKLKKYFFKPTQTKQIKK